MNAITLEKDLKRCIRDVANFPKQGIIFKDITTLLGNPKPLKRRWMLWWLSIKGKKIDYVVAVESRGFIFGSVLAYKLGAGFVPVPRRRESFPIQQYL